jgi:Thioesterase superfamily
MRGRSGPFWDGVEGRAPMPPAAATLEPDQFQSTLQLSVSFLRPVRPGRVIGKGRIVHRNGELVFLEAALIDANGAVSSPPPPRPRG